MVEDNLCIQIINSHVSIRSYTDEPINMEDLKIILESARRAPTAWNLMPVHVSAILDPDLKRRAAEAVGGQEHVAKSAVFLVFSLDFEKIIESGRETGVEMPAPNIAHIIEGAIDAGIMAGWAGIAAESLGYGLTYIAAYGNPCGLRDALRLPKGLVPIVGISIGRPAEKPSPSSRQEKVYSIDSNVPETRERAKAVIEIYGERAVRLFKRVLSVESGYYEWAAENILKCLRESGYKI